MRTVNSFSQKSLTGKEKFKRINGKTFCPLCYVVEWRNKKIWVPFFFGIFSRLKNVEYLYSPPRSEYPDRIEVLEDKNINSYCGKCGHILGICLEKMTKKQIKDFKDSIK